MAYTKLFNWAIDAIRQPKIIDARLDAEFGAVATATSAADGVAGASSLSGGRLTLTSNVAVTTTDVAGATSIYFTFAGHNYVRIYNGTSWVLTPYTQLTLALDSNSGHTGYHQSANIFDLFIIDNGGVTLGTGPSWASGAVAGSLKARGTGAGSTEIELKDGFWTNKNSIVIRFGSASGNTVTISANRATYVGSFIAPADGQATDTALDRLLYNVYNQTLRTLQATEPAVVWNYSTRAWQQVNANAANHVAILQGLEGGEISLSAMHLVVNSTATVRNVATGIGIDSTTVNSARSTQAQPTSAVLGNPVATYEGYVPLGYTRYDWLEYGAVADTQTWIGLGSQGIDNPFASGLTGRVLA